MYNVQGNIYVLFGTKNWSYLNLPCTFIESKTVKKIFRQSWKKKFQTISHFCTVSFTTSETKLDYYHQKVIIRVFLRAAERLKT